MLLAIQHDNMAQYGFMQQKKKSFLTEIMLVDA